MITKGIREKDVKDGRFGSGAASRAVFSRIPAAAAMIAVASAGLAARNFLSGFWAKYLGVALWAAAVYALFFVVYPRWRLHVAAICALAVCWAVEFAQLTPVPGWLSSKHFALRLIFGETFSVWDLPAYGAGVIMATGVHVMMKRSLGKKRSDGELP